MNNQKFILLVFSLVICSTCLLDAQTTAKIKIDIDKKGSSIDPLQYGLFYEEIERAGDGGLYAEMIQNRSFEGFRNGFEFENRINRGIMPVMDAPNNIPAWELIGNGKMSLDQSEPLNTNNPTSLKVESNGYVSLINAGFLPTDKKEGLGVGLACRKNEAFELTLYARKTEDFNGELSAILEGKNGTVLAEKTIKNINGDWNKYVVDLTPINTDVNSRLVLKAKSKGTFWLDMVSLFPKDTYKNRPNGLRKDLAEMLADLNPSFVRFPGGCFVEGLYQLKEGWRPLNTLGDVAQRQELPGARWQYGSTNGLGYFEMLQMCEDLGAEPILVVNAAMSHGAEGIVRFDDTGAQFTGFLKEALDAIEYANGDTTTEWGRIRAIDGHPKPFNLKYIQIGNEDGAFPSYEYRFDIFYNKIIEKYPYMNIISNVSLTKNYSQMIIDEHYYPSVDWCIENFFKYDSYKRDGAKIFIGEFGVIADSSFTTNSSVNNLKTALGEAIFWLGAERNSDLVSLACFAPLLCRYDQKMWPANLIYFDQNIVFGSPSYYVFKLLSNNRGDMNLNIKATSMPCVINGQKFQESIYSGATFDEKTSEVILKIVNLLSDSQKAIINIEGAKKIIGNVTSESLANSKITTYNSLDYPSDVIPIAEKNNINIVSNTFTYEFKANSFTIIRIPVELSESNISGNKIEKN